MSSGTAMSSSSGSMSDRDSSSADLRLTSAEGLPIRSTIVRPDRPHGVVVIVHGYKGFRQWGFFPWLARQLAACNLASLRFDMSRNGIGEDSESFDRLDLFEDDAYSIQLADLRTVNEYLDTTDLAALPRFFLGHSRGGAVAILGATDQIDLAGVVTWSSIARVDRWDQTTKKQWKRQGYFDVINARTRQVMRSSSAFLDDLERNRERLDVRAAVSRLRTPLLAVHGKEDESVPPTESEEIVAAAPDASLVLIPNGSHTFGAIHPLVDVPATLRLAFEVTEKFISSHAHAATRRRYRSSSEGGVSLPPRE